MSVIWLIFKLAVLGMLYALKGPPPIILLKVFFTHSIMNKRNMISLNNMNEKPVV